MKTFTYDGKVKAGSTLTVKELKEELSKYPDDMPVFAEWEDVLAFFSPENFFIEPVHKGEKAEEVAGLVILVENY